MIRSSVKRTCIAAVFAGLSVCQLQSSSLAATEPGDGTSARTDGQSIDVMARAIRTSAYEAVGNTLLAAGPDSSDDDTTDSTTPPADSGSSGSTAGDAQRNAPRSLEDRESLEGKIELKAQALEQALKGLSKGVHHLKRATWDIFCEAQRQDVTVVAEPDVIGPIIVPAIPSASGMISNGFLPPRKKWLDYFIGQVDQLLPIIESEIQAIDLPEQTPESIDQLKQIKECGGALPGDLKNIKTSCAGPDLDNMKIAVNAQRMQDHIVKIEKTLKTLAEEIHKEDADLKKDLKQLEKQIEKGKK